MTKTESKGRYGDGDTEGMDNIDTSWLDAESNQSRHGQCHGQHEEGADCVNMPS